MPSNENHEVIKPETIGRSAIYKVLAQNRREYLWQCFHFGLTPQGHDYWKGIEALPPETPLPAEAVAYLQELRDGKIPEHEV